MKEIFKLIDSKIINNISFDSRNVNPNTLFVCRKGNTADGHDFIDDVIQKGVKHIVIMDDFTPKNDKNIHYYKVKDTDIALAEIAAHFYNYPSTKLKLIGITGTNGKTTTATLLYDLFYSMGYPVGLISTIEIRINNKILPTTHTTPDTLTLNKILKEMEDSGVEYVFMEVSSHAIVQKRIYGLTFFGGVFTNLTHDHLDYHKTFADYRDAKKQFFDILPKTAFALSNYDDPNGEVMLQNTKAKKFFYSTKTIKDFHIKIIEQTLEGQTLIIDNYELTSYLTGKFNAYNLLAIYAVAVLCGLDREEAVKNISKLQPANGRFNIMRTKNGAFAVVDYAHTPDALLNVISTINDIKSRKLFVVSGCGGDRDKSKRPIMGRIAAQNSDFVILTSDNPRTENPQTIIDEMYSGIEIKDREKAVKILDRKEAIITALRFANKDDVVLIAGKGHETYQEINGVRSNFDDKKIIEEFGIMN